MKAEENYYLKEKICPRCSISKSLICFTSDHKMCKDCRSCLNKKNRIKKQ